MTQIRSTLFVDRIHTRQVVSWVAMRRGWIAGALLTVATLAVYAPVLGFEFVNYDDPIIVSNNAKAAHGLSARGLAWAFTSTQAANWFPSTRLSHLLDVTLFGLDPAGHHATNLLLHLANALLLFFGLRWLTGSFWRSLLVAALFALHPVHVENVAWVSERKGVLSTTFWLLTTWAYVAWTRQGGAYRMALTTLLLALGLMSKSMLVSLPLTLLLLDAWPLERWRDMRDTREGVIEKWPLFGVVAVSCLITLYVQRNAMGLGFDPAPVELRLANAASSALRYLELAVWPSGLAVMHPHPYLEITGGRPLGPARVLGACLALAALCWLLLGRWSRPWMRTGWLWYGVTLLPVTGLVQVGHQAYAERYAYVPLMGIYVIVAWSAGMLAERGDAWRRAAVVTSLAALLAFGSVARQQLHHWHDSIALFTRGVEISPESGVTHHNLAVALLVAQRVQPAQQHFELAIEVEPQNPRYLNNLGRLHQLAGRPLEAVPYHERAIAVGPRNAIGKNCYIDSRVSTSGNCVVGDGLTLRYDTILARGCRVGDRTYVCPRVMTNNLDTGGEQIGGAHIGADCFIGTNTVFQHGVTIGDRVVTGAMSFVNKDIPAGEIWIGSPAKFYKANG